MAGDGCRTCLCGVERWSIMTTGWKEGSEPEGGECHVILHITTSSADDDDECSPYIIIVDCICVYSSCDTLPILTMSAYPQDSEYIAHALQLTQCSIL